MDPDRKSRFEARLLAMRDAIVGLESVRREGSAVVELDQSRTGRLSRMDALQMQAMASAGRERAATELRHIDAALARISADKFGECVECGDEIAPARLEVQPAAALCLACASNRERR